LGKNVRKPQGGIFLTHTVVVVAGTAAASVAVRYELTGLTVCGPQLLAAQNKCNYDRNG